MSVYEKEKAENLSAALDSMLNQTVQTDDLVLMCDGPLNEALDGVIAASQAEHPELHVFRLEKNVGLGNALNIGLKHCKHELIARMDSDDISRPDRCARQVEVFRKNPEISLCSGIVEEFSVSPDRVESRRVVPETQEEIMRFAKSRNPFNHPCMMMRKSAVEDAGGYQAFYLLEDYYLWIRMLQKGAVGYNIQDPLLWMRTGSAMYQRRAGWKYAMSQKKLFTFMKNTEFIGNGQYLMRVMERVISSILPNPLRRYLFITVMRKK